MNLKKINKYEISKVNFILKRLKFWTDLGLINMDKDKGFEITFSLRNFTKLKKHVVLKLFK